MQKCQKKRGQYPLIALVLFAFIVFSVFFNGSNVEEISPSEEHPFLVSKNLTALKLNSARELDKSSKCHYTVEYSGRGANWDAPVPESGGRREMPESCDFFSGEWVFDNTSHPLYSESDCPYMSDQLACQKHGRPENGYQHWRWQPHGCDLKRWNATEVWEKLRGKRLMFVGDSLNRNQWMSMVCMLQSVIPSDKRYMSPQQHLSIFRTEEYNASVEFLWAPLLVESNSDHPVDHRLSERILRPDSHLRHSSHWRNADILVFNSYLWWRQGPVKLLWSNEQDGACEEIDGLRGMELAMRTWADWVASNIDPLKKQVFFVTMSPTHQSKEGWEPGSEGNCYDEKLPITNRGYWGNGSDVDTMQMVGRVLGDLGTKVSVLNITKLSEYRKDGHPTIYRKFWEALSPEKLANPASYSDCIHWCLPGVPDVWNELLFQFL
ncbi:PREDICTED: protein trichome birefringence-like 35 [Ipomoea nil]|uniref:protein trichome birefringence-like 35 n=1 Tax=Ipomoea nil TaxID=35883 RepID=UPI0009018FB1|nr:PREDICTED: protein trichome birefringence-like 35 [Ipomoea nil]